MSQKIVKLVEKFTGANGQDITKWITRTKLLFELHKINDDEAALLLPLILDGDAFSSYIEMDPDQRKSADAVFKVLTTAFACNEYEAYRKFISLRLLNNQSPDAFLTEIRLWARLALIENEAQIRQCFIVGLPSEISTAVQSAAETGKLTMQQILTEAKIRIGALQRPYHGLAARSASKLINQEKNNKIEYPPSTLSTRCFNCNQTGHIARFCRNNKQQSACPVCGKFGHKEDDCWHLKKISGNDSADSSAPVNSAMTNGRQ